MPNLLASPNGAARDFIAVRREAVARPTSGFLPSNMGARLTAVALALALVAGCATKPVAAPEPAPAIVSLQEYMQQGAKANADGSPEKARDAYRAASKAYPTAKEPWLKLAEDYFAAGDYGNAILAAQEVLQRESSDNVAASILAVSGLRVSAAALRTLRSQDRLVGGARSEAEILARTLREVLGEPVLVPPPPPPPAPPPRRIAKPRPPAGAASGAAAAAAPAPAPAAAPASGSPFDKLK
jgi:hypothetical protein